MHISPTVNLSALKQIILIGTDVNVGEVLFVDQLNIFQFAMS